MNMANRKLYQGLIGQWIGRYGARAADWPILLRPCLLVFWCLPAFRRQWRAVQAEDRALAACYQQLPTLSVSDDLRQRLLLVAEHEQIPARQRARSTWRLSAAGAMASLGLGLAIGLSGGSAGWLAGGQDYELADDYLESPDQYLFSSYDVGEWLAGDES